jgi:hypothetical protein
LISEASLPAASAAAVVSAAAASVAAAVSAAAFVSAAAVVEAVLEDPQAANEPTIDAAVRTARSLFFINYPPNFPRITILVIPIYLFSLNRLLRPFIIVNS